MYERKLEYFNTFDEKVWPQNRREAERLGVDLGYDTLICLMDKGELMGRSPWGIWCVGIEKNLTRIKRVLNYERKNKRKVVLWAKKKEQVYDLYNIFGGNISMEDYEELINLPKYLCHSTAINNFKQIVKDNALLSYNELIKMNRTVKTIRGKLREPHDFLDYIDLASIDSLSPEKVVASRQYSKLNFNLDLRYSPGVRIYFSSNKVKKLYDTCCDGLHILKIYKKINLESAIGIVFPSKKEMETFIINNREHINSNIISKFLFAETENEWTPRKFTREANKTFIESKTEGRS
ncbi:hypothetical protein [Sporosalibacterium faouarense]|uniref:hypothetical protein n=1 Tax=Sporosalibacterium faouarense TaxID=516123 RepID=UPI00192C3703|nr:hypothetical protein [Sporosalibacterium faouarense]